MFQKLINLFKRSKVIHVLLFLMVLSLFCCGYIVWDSKQAAVWSAVTKTCTGEGAVEAAAYTDDAGLHPVVYLQGGGSRWRAASLGYFTTPGDWLPEDVSQVELVACMTEEVVTIETCEYDIAGSDKSKTVIRTQSQISVTLYEAQTGKQLEESKLFVGQEPKECGDSEKFSNKVSEKTFAGDRPEISQIEAWLKPHIEK